MIFPEVAERVKNFIDGFGGTPTLGLSFESKDTFSIGGAANEWYARNGFNQIYAALGGGSGTWSGESINTDRALNHSVVWACNRAISEPVGFLPLNMMQRTAAGKDYALSHPMYGALHDAPNDLTGAMSFRETLTSHALLQGNGYARILRRSGTGTAIELDQLVPSQVEIQRDKQGRLVYVVKESGSPDKSFPVERGKPHDILHVPGIGWDGMRGYSVITMARQSIGTAVSAERNVGRFFANGGRVPYHLEMASKFKSDEDFKQFAARWGEKYSEPHKVPILENDIKLVKDGLSMADSQMLETRQFSIPEICRWFNISPYLAGDHSRLTFSNVEQLAIDHVKFCLNAWFTRWEQALYRCVLTPEERKQGYFFKFNVNALLRGDFVSRMAGYASALQNGHLNQDEVRDYEDLNPLPNGEGSHYRVQLNMQTLTADGQPPVDPAAAQLDARKPIKTKFEEIPDPAAAYLAERAKKERAPIQ